MRKKRESLILAELFQKLGRQLGAKVLLEPEWRLAGQITFKNGKRSYFRYNTLDLNPVGAADIAKDKDYANFFMRRMGYKTVPGKTFFSDEWCKAIGSKRNADAAARFARRRYPLIIKPNSGTHGTNVYLAHGEPELRFALKQVFRHDKVALVQKYVQGHDLRIVVLDGKVISGYERIPLNVLGDGRSTIRRLLQKKAHAFRAASRDTRIRFDDPRIALKLRHQKLSMRSTPGRGERIFLLDNANLSSGGDAIDVTKKLHSGLKKLAAALTRDMGLRICGVDLMVGNDLAKAPKHYLVLEINAAPGLDHYVKSGKAQEKIVEAMYGKVLRSLSKRSSA